MRRELTLRPMLLLAAGLALGIAAHDTLLVAALALLLALALQRPKPGLVLAAGFALGAALARPPAQPLLESRWLDAQARVASVPRLHPDTATCEIQLVTTRLLMTVPRKDAPVLGQTLRVQGVARPFREGTEGNWLRKGVVGKVKPQTVAVIGEAPWIWRLGDAWRNSFIAFCERTLPPRAAAAAEALCFNVDTMLDPDDQAALRRSGTVHVVSASGLHVGFFAAALALLLARLPIPRPLQLAALALILVAYAAATGLRPPVVRAVLMLLTLAPAYLARREPDLLSAIGLAATLQLLADPAALHDIGFQLSFLVVAALAVFVHRHEPAERDPVRRAAEWTGRTLRQGTVAYLAAAPLLLYHFGLLSLTSVPANLLLAAAVPAIVVTALAAHLVGLLLPAVAGLGMDLVVGPLAGWLFGVLDLFGGEWAAVEAPPFSAWWVVAAYASGLALLRVRLRPA